MTGASFSVPFFRRSVGTGDRDKLLCTLLYAAVWAQMTGASFSVPFFRRSVGTGDRGKLLCTLLPLNYYLSSGHFFFCIYPF